MVASLAAPAGQLGRYSAGDGVMAHGRDPGRVGRHAGQARKVRLSSGCAATCSTLGQLTQAGRAAPAERSRVKSSASRARWTSIVCTHTSPVPLSRGRRPRRPGWRGPDQPNPGRGMPPSPPSRGLLGHAGRFRAGIVAVQAILLSDHGLIGTLDRCLERHHAAARRRRQ